MSFDSLLRHRATITRQVAVLDINGDPTYDSRGQPITTADDVLEDWPVLVQPLTAREEPILSQQGAVVADHVIFSRPASLSSADVVTLTDGRQFEVDSVDDAGGQGRHLEAKARRITSPDVPLPPS